MTRRPVGDGEEDWDLERWQWGGTGAEVDGGGGIWVGTCCGE